MFVFRKCSVRVISQPLLSSQLGTFARSKPKYLSGDKVFVYCPWAPVRLERVCLSVSPGWRHPTFLAFFLPLPCISVSWLYWLKCSRSESVTLGDKKAVLHPAYVLIFQSTDWDRARGYPTIEKKIFIWFDNNKKLRPADWIDLKLILTKAGGELWQFRIDLGFFLFHSSSELNILSMYIT